MSSISHDWLDETPEAKAKWFQSLPVEQRFDIFCEFTDLILEMNPTVADHKDAEPVVGRVRVLELARS